jgi:L-alanine-DL-glutamate epimerase-like enolase superfamily enzyme
MKITELRSTIVALPTPRKAAPELGVGHYRLAVLVEVLTDGGLIGLGEAPNPVGVEATKVIIDSAEPLLIGEDPANVEVLKKKLYAHYNLTHLHIHAACWALNGIDMALWDLVGKACDRPLYQIWGGAFRKQIEFYGPIDRASPEDVAIQAADLAKAGFQTLYMKVGFDEKEDVACVRAIREAIGPGLKIRVDANQSWSAGEAVRIIRRLSDFDLEFVDQPVLMYNVDALARVRSAVDVPIASHESSWTMYDALNVLKRGAADVIHVDPRFDAGFMGARLTAGMAEAAGMPVVVHSFGELGVAQCAYMHLIASAPNFILANQSGYHRLTDDVIRGGLLAFKDGCLDLPEEPGIGVELDPEKVQTYTEYYRENIKGREFSQPWLTPQYMLMQYRRFFGY